MNLLHDLREARKARALFNVELNKLNANHGRPAVAPDDGDDDVCRLFVEAAREIERLGKLVGELQDERQRRSGDIQLMNDTLQFLRTELAEIKAERKPRRKK